MLPHITRYGVLAVLAVTTVCLIVANLFAHHNGKYLATHSTFQYGSGEGDTSGLRELFTPARWTLSNATSTTLRWYSSAATTTKHMERAANNWMRIVPEFKYQKVISESAAQVVIKYETCPDGDYGTVFFQDDSGGEWEADFIRQARYWTKVEICISNVNYYQHENDIGANIAHELGHLYGLYDQWTIADEPHPDLPAPIIPSRRA